MYIFLVAWIIFIVAYLVFNLYGIYRIVKMRLKGDAVGIIVLVYVIAMSAIIFLSVSAISFLDWSLSFRDLINF